MKALPQITRILVTNASKISLSTLFNIWNVKKCLNIKYFEVILSVFVVSAQDDLYTKMRTLLNAASYSFSEFLYVMLCYDIWLFLFIFKIPPHKFMFVTFFSVLSFKHVYPFVNFKKYLHKATLNFRWNVKSLHQLSQILKHNILN